VSYHFQPNAGKHIAINKAVSLARGKWFYIADGDDAIVPETLQVFMREGIKYLQLNKRVLQYRCLL
jgi:glycosyltransferase involved in cell wall biosynthesis